MGKSRTGQKYRNRSITVEAEAEIEEFSTLDLVDELLDRLAKNDPDAAKWVRETPDGPKWSPGLDDLGWPDVERALLARDFDAIARWLWPQVRKNYPRPRFVPLGETPVKEEHAHG